MLAARASPDVSLDDDGVRLAQPKQLRGEQAYDLGFAAPRCVLVQEARAMLAIVGPRVLLLSDRRKLSPQLRTRLWTTCEKEAVE